MYFSICLRHSSPCVKAAMVAIGAKMVGSFSSFAASQRKNLVRNSALGTMANELTMPAMLNVLEGAPKVMEMSAARWLTVAKGVWRLPNKAMSA